MAEFLNHRNRSVPRGSDIEITGTDGFSAMGKPIPLYRRQAALKHCQAMGLTTNQAWTVVGAVSDQLERDEPYKAMAAGMRGLDLTGTYRLMAVLLTAPDPDVPRPPPQPAKGGRR